MAGKTILAVFGDRGGYNALEPVLLKALDAGCTVRLYLTATCGGQYTEKKLKPDPRFEVYTGDWNESSVHQFMEKPHDLLALGSSQSENGSWAGLYALTRNQAPVLVMQDAYGSAAPMLLFLSSRPVSPAQSTICVTDEFSKAHLQQVELMGKDRVTFAVTGGPHLDKTIEVRRGWDQRRQILRQALGISDDQPVFLIAGGLNGTAEILTLLQGGIEQAGLNGKARVILRAHPRATDDDKRLVAEYMATTPYKDLWFMDVPDRSLAPTSDDLLPGVDFVLSGYSTTNTFGVLYQMPGVAYVGTSAFQKDLKAEKGLDRPPEVSAGAAWYVQTADDMANVITSVRLGARVVPDLLKIVTTQKDIASYNDGRATERVWAEMQKLLQ